MGADTDHGPFPCAAARGRSMWLSAPTSQRPNSAAAFTSVFKVIDLSSGSRMRSTCEPLVSRLSADAVFVTYLRSSSVTPPRRRYSVTSEFPLAIRWGFQVISLQININTVRLDIKIAFCTCLYILILMKMDQALKYVAKCEADVRALIEQALEARQYEQIPALANLAAAVAGLVATQTSEPSLTANSSPEMSSHAVTSSVTSAPQANIAVSRRVAKSNKYPKFERTNDRLVKIGWSKKDRSEYEHKVPYDVVDVVLAALSAKLIEVEYLKMDDLIPLDDKLGQEIPSYQTYLVVAWLRDIGVVEKQGNDGYHFADMKRTALDLESLWQQTTERR